MVLTVGTRLGAYEILNVIGAGGMGEVYRARDTKLGRDIALKILPGLFAADADRLARFQREAQVLASLNHPNIAHIHGLEESHPSAGSGQAALSAIVMELVEGPTLAEHLEDGTRESGYGIRVASSPESRTTKPESRRGLPVDEALAIARQIADALEAAHEQGIIHRDLKPANIKVREDGTVKLLDFGLAKALDQASGLGPQAASAMNSPTLSIHATQAGVILGTAAYMSPEQAKGKAVDRRADIWAFGVVLCEMLTGRPLYSGETVTETLARVIEREPDLTALPAATPASIRTLLGRCLTKDPRSRLQAIGEARISIERTIAHPEDRQSESARSTDADWRRAPVWRRSMPWLLFASTLLGFVLVLALGAPWRRAVPSTPVRVSAELGVDASLVYLNAGAAAVLSPDGSVLAFVAQKSGGKPQLFVRRLEQLQASPLSGTEDASSPFFSPDGQWIAYFADAKLKKVAASGGASVTLCDAPAGRGGAWGEDGAIVFSPSNSPGVSLQRVSSAGGKPEPLTTLDQGETTQRFPQVLPGGKAVLYMSHNANGNYDEANLVVQPLPSGPRKVVVRGGHYGRYLPSGHLVYMHGGTLFAAPFDLDRLETTGQPVPAIEGVTSSSASGGGAQFATSATGTLVYLPGQGVGGAPPVQWLDRFGKTTILRAAGAFWSNPHFAPDGRRLALDIFDNRQTDVWVYDWERDTASRLTLDAANDEKPVWTPDGRRIVFRSTRNPSSNYNLYWQRADGTGEVQRLTESKNPQFPASWHPSGRFLAFYENQTSYDVMILPLEGDDASGWKPGKPTAFVNSPFAEQEPMFSPDGRWLAYMSNDNGRDEVYVRPFPGPGGKWLVSTEGGAYVVTDPA